MHDCNVGPSESIPIYYLVEKESLTPQLLANDTTKIYSFWARTGTFDHTIYHKHELAGKKKKQLTFFLTKHKPTCIHVLYTISLSVHFHMSVIIKYWQHV